MYISHVTYMWSIWGGGGGNWSCKKSVQDNITASRIVLGWHVCTVKFPPPKKNQNESSYENRHETSPKSQINSSIVVCVQDMIGIFLNLLMAKLSTDWTLKLSFTSRMSMHASGHADIAVVGKGSCLLLVPEHLPPVHQNRANLFGCNGNGYHSPEKSCVQMILTMLGGETMFLAIALDFRLSSRNQRILWSRLSLSFEARIRDFFAIEYFEWTAIFSAIQLREMTPNARNFMKNRERTAMRDFWYTQCFPKIYGKGRNKHIQAKMCWNGIFSISAGISLLTNKSWTSLGLKGDRKIHWSKQFAPLPTK